MQTEHQPEDINHLPQAESGQEYKEPEAHQNLNPNENSPQGKEESVSENCEENELSSNEGDKDNESVSEAEEPKERELWPLEPHDVYSLTVLSKQKALQTLQTKLTIEKSQRRGLTTVDDYDKDLSKLNFVEAQTFSEKLQRIRADIGPEHHRKIKKRKAADEPGYIRVFKYYVDQIGVKLKQQPVNN